MFRFTRRICFSVHLISVLGWSDTSVSVLSGAWGTLIVVVVALLGGWLADRIGARNLLIIVMIIHASYMLVANLLEPYWEKRPVATAVLILWNMMDPILSTAAMPVLMALCRKHVEGNPLENNRRRFEFEVLFFHFLGSQFTTYMSMVNLCDLAGAFFSGHLQRHVRANVIGLGCATLIIFALVTTSFGVWYDRRKKSEEKEKTKSLDETNSEDCWPLCLCTRYRRSTLKIVV